MSPRNIAIVSTGGAGRTHVRRLEKNPRILLRALFNIKEDGSVKLESYEARGTHLTTGFKYIHNDHEVDVICVCSSDSTQHSLQLRCVGWEAGKHVLVEKPMAITIDQCQEIASVVEANPGSRRNISHRLRRGGLYCSNLLSDN